MSLLSYVLITPARDEAQFIELTIRSVLAQTVKPLKWVIVSDGSTDGTDEIVSRYVSQHPWIELVSLPVRRERHFEGKVHAFRAGFDRLKNIDYQIIGNLDADISFDSEFFEFLLKRMVENPYLGIAGTAFFEGTERYDYRFTNIEHVSGQCQMFRRECYEAIGGYMPSISGGIDLIAVVSARAAGWQTRTFTEKHFQHHRLMASALYPGFRRSFFTGKKDYLLGGHPLWELFRSVYQMSRKPTVTGGALIFAGYSWAWLSRQKRTMPENLVPFVQAEQIHRLKLTLLRPLRTLRLLSPYRRCQAEEARALGGRGELTSQLPAAVADPVRPHKIQMNAPSQIVVDDRPPNGNAMTYVLITPARDEAAFIGRTLESVISQTVRPTKWVIVSDGSTDGTDDIVQQYARRYPWIELVRLPDRATRHFAGKVHAFNAGYARLSDTPYEVIASLDADISFDKSYFAYLLQKLSEDPRLGLVGTPFKEEGTPPYDYRFVNIEHVSGACQVFRRACFESVGGYVPVKGGCIDHIAAISSRMKGWKTRTFTDNVCHHHRPMGTAQVNQFEASFRRGGKDYAIGNHPLWEVFRSLYQLSRPPLILGGVAVASGYLWAMMSGAGRPVPPELVQFARHEQMQRLKAFLSLGKAAQLRVAAFTHRS